MSAASINIDGARAEARLEFLDSLRGLAAFYVFLCHLQAISEFTIAPSVAVVPWIGAGYSGVLLFFMVSAFSLCLTMPRHMERPLPFVSFYVHRIFRILPLFYFVLLASIFRELFIFDRSPGILPVVFSVFLINNLSPIHQTGEVVWAGWTISLEMLFYTVFPFIFIYINDVKKFCCNSSYIFSIYAFKVCLAVFYFFAIVSRLSQVVYTSIRAIFFDGCWNLFFIFKVWFLYHSKEMFWVFVFIYIFIYLFIRCSILQ